MYNKVLKASAAKIAAELPDTHIYVDEIPQKADGKMAIRIVEDKRVPLVNRVRYAFTLEVLYFQAEHDAFTYGEWINSMYKALCRVNVDGLVLIPRNMTARQDSDSRFYQFLFDLEFSVISIIAEDPMETVEVEIKVSENKNE